MLLVRQILVSTIVLGLGAVGLTACGQQGPLYLPTDPAAVNRATLPETLFRSRPATALPTAAPASAPATPPASATTPAPQ